jgi:hypothetical protein
MFVFDLQSGGLLVVSQVWRGPWVDAITLFGIPSGRSDACGGGGRYGLALDMIDCKGRMLNIPRTKNEKPVHVP